MAKRAAKAPDLFTFSLTGKRSLSMGMVRRNRERSRTAEDFGELDKFVLSEAKRACKRRRAMTGYKWSVDHLIPLARHGLHAWHNIQVIPEKLNAWKGARLVLTLPGEWVAMLPGGTPTIFSEIT